MLALFGYFVAAFIVTGMVSQLFPDGRFPFTTTLLVIALSTLGAGLGHRYLGESSIFTGALLGAAATSSLLLFLFHRTGLLAQTPWPTPPEGQPQEERSANEGEKTGSA